METETDAALIDRIALAIESIARRTRPIPLSVDLWDSETIAQYLKRKRQTVLEKIVCLPDFPGPIKLPNSLPLWKAAEVIAWAEAHRGIPRGRPRKDRRDD